MLSFFGLVVLAILLLSTQQSSAKTVCVEGFVMDTFCIYRGTLLDNSAVKTLENPEQHSVHCLVDISACVDSGYNILELDPSGSSKYRVAYKLDDAGNKMVLNVARSIGSACSTCSGSTNQITKGFRATVVGEFGAGENSGALLKVVKLIASPKLNDPNGGSGCETLLINPSNSSSIAASPSYTMNKMTMSPSYHANTMTVIHPSNSSSIAASPSYTMKKMTMSPSYHVKTMTVIHPSNSSSIAASPSYTMKKMTMSPSYHAKTMTVFSTSSMKMASGSPSYTMNKMETTMINIATSPSMPTKMSTTHASNRTTTTQEPTTTEKLTTTRKNDNEANKLSSSTTLQGKLSLSLVSLMMAVIIMTLNI